MTDATLTFELPRFAARGVKHEVGLCIRQADLAEFLHHCAGCIPDDAVATSEQIRELLETLAEVIGAARPTETT